MIEMKVEDHLDGACNFISWKSRVLLILEENDLLKFVNEKVSKRKVEDEKVLYGKESHIWKLKKAYMDSSKHPMLGMDE